MATCVYLCWRVTDTQHARINRKALDILVACGSCRFCSINYFIKSNFRLVSSEDCDSSSIQFSWGKFVTFKCNAMFLRCHRLKLGVCGWGDRDVRTKAGSRLRRTRPDTPGKKGRSGHLWWTLRCNRQIERCLASAVIGCRRLCLALLVSVHREAYHWTSFLLTSATCLLRSQPQLEKCT